MREENIDITHVADDLAKAYEKGYEDGKPKWIPVEEKLPRELEDVLVSAKGIHNPIIGWRGSTGFRDALGGHLEVTHWMPLPEMPKDGE